MWPGTVNNVPKYSDCGCEMWHNVCMMLSLSSTYKYCPGSHHGQLRYLLQINALPMCGLCKGQLVQFYDLQQVMNLREQENIGDSFGRGLKTIVNWNVDGQIFPMNIEMWFIFALPGCRKYYSGFVIRRILCVFNAGLLLKIRCNSGHGCVKL